MNGLKLSRNFLSLSLAILPCAVLLALPACSNSTKDFGNKIICSTGTCKSGANALEAMPNVVEPKAPSAPTPTPIPALDDKTVMLKLREECTGCHGLGRDKRSFWPMPSEFDTLSEAELKAAGKTPSSDPTFLDTFEKIIASPTAMEKLKAKIEADQFSVEVFQTIENRILDKTVGKPLPMRPGMSAAERKSFSDLMSSIAALATPIASNAQTANLISQINKANAWCVGCHSPGGSGAFVWAKANGTLEDWRAFALSAKEAVDSGEMPPAKLTGAKRDSWAGVLAWFQKNFPMVVADARGKYHGTGLSLGTIVNYDYKCSNLVSGREFLNRLTQDALGRAPTLDELNLFKDIDKRVTPELRAKAVEMLALQWREEFIAYGFKRFAERVSGSENIRKLKTVIDAQLAQDISDEFFQMVKESVLAGRSYKDVLLSDQVYASKSTGPLYGAACAEKTKFLEVGKFVLCDLKADNSPRDTFFTTLAFLSSKPSSMLSENNNYGRVAALNEVIRGDTLQANTTGEEGEAVKPLPECLKTSDWRVVSQGEGKFAPRGTARIPATGNFCQGCHVRRNLAAGSIVFRPFGPFGQILTYDKLESLTKKAENEVTGLDALLRKDVLSASGSKWGQMYDGGSTVESFNLIFFKSFLDIGSGPGQEQACAVEDDTQKQVIFKNVGDLARYYLTDELTMARGLARIVPRAMSNLNATNSEVISAMSSAWTKGGGKLMPLFQSYFLSETFACQSAGAQ